MSSAVFFSLPGKIHGVHELRLAMPIARLERGTLTISAADR
jgi:hypothetical protein